MTPDELRQARRGYGLTQAGLAEIMGTSTNTVARWERGEVVVNQGWVKLAFEVLAFRKRGAGSHSVPMPPASGRTIPVHPDFLEKRRGKGEQDA